MKPDDLIRRGLLNIQKIERRGKTIVVRNGDDSIALGVGIEGR